VSSFGGCVALSSNFRVTKTTFEWVDELILRACDALERLYTENTLILWFMELSYRISLRIPEFSILVLVSCVFSVGLCASRTVSSKAWGCQYLRLALSAEAGSHQKSAYRELSNCIKGFSAGDLGHEDGRSYQSRDFLGTIRRFWTPGGPCETIGSWKFVSCHVDLLVPQPVAVISGTCDRLD
jgi:hypothetical protein